MQALAGELIDRGHRVSWLGPPDLARRVSDPRIAFAPVGSAGDGAASFEQRAARPDGLGGLLRLVDEMARTTTLLCTAGRAVLERIGAEALIADQMEAAGGLLGEVLGLPFASVACALPINREPRVPLPVMPWGFAETEQALHRNAISARVYDRLMRAHGRAIEVQCRRLGLPSRGRLDECLSPHLQLSQTPAGFDFPRVALPPGFHAVGPLRPPVRASLRVGTDRPDRFDAAQLWDRPDRLGLVNLADRPDRPVIEPAAGSPFIFISLGTLQGGRFSLFMRIVRACRSIGVQSLVAHCGGLDARQAEALRAAGATWVTDFADQRAVLARADAVVTHAGLNTVLDALEAGVPALALPIAFDQPGVAARLARTGAGLVLSHRWASAGGIGRALQRLLAETAFATRAAAVGAALPAAGGAGRAATLIEAALGPSGPRFRPAAGSSRFV